MQEFPNGFSYLPCAFIGAIQSLVDGGATTAEEKNDKAQKNHSPFLIHFALAVGFYE